MHVEFRYIAIDIMRKKFILNPLSYRAYIVKMPYMTGIVPDMQKDNTHMRKKILSAVLISLLALSFCGCSKKEDASQTAEGLDWPTQYMSTLPEPDSKITYIERLNVEEEIPESDTTTQPTSVNVIMNEMTKKEAESYYETLKSSDFQINSDEVTDEKILLVGQLNDDDKNPFVFSYLKDEDYGNISITYWDAVYSK